MPELVATFSNAGDDLRAALSAVETAGQNFLPTIGTELKDLINEKMVTPFLGIIDAKTMNCGFMLTAYTDLLDAACYSLGGTIASYASTFTFCVQCGFMLVLIIFGLWRFFLDMYELAQKDGLAVKAFTQEAEAKAEAA